MKRIIIALSVIFITASSFANDIKIPLTIAQDFHTTFTTAKDVLWTVKGGFTVAEFTLDGKKQYAYYNQEGLVVVAQPLEVKDLSSTLQSNLQRKYNDYTVSDLFQVKDEEGTKYFAIVKKDNKELIVTATSKKWYLFHVVRK